ncbi:MAG: hypothetical protein ACYC56_09370 [Candidatus Aquicultor sp.]
MLDPDILERNQLHQIKANGYIAVSKQTGFALIQALTSASDAAMDAWINPKSPLSREPIDPKYPEIFEEGFIVLNLKDLNLRSFNPLDQKDLLNDFQSIGYDQRITELDFVNKYGLLGFINIDKARASYFYYSSFNDTGNILSTFIEPLAWLRKQQEEYLTLVDIYECLASDSKPSLVLLYLQQLLENAGRCFTEINLPPLVNHILESSENDRDNLFGLGLLFKMILEEKLKPINLTLHLMGKPAGKFSWGYASDSKALIHSIYLMFWREITKQTELKTCPGCGAKFFVKPGKGRKPIYHSVLCEEAAKQRRRRREGKRGKNNG